MLELGDGTRRRSSRGRRDAAGASLDLLVVVEAPGGAPRASPRAPARAGSRRTGWSRRRTRRRRVGVLRAQPAARRRRPRQGVARRRSWSGSSTACVDGARAAPEVGRGDRSSSIQGLLLAFALVVILMPPYIRLLRHFGFGKQIREEGPQSHMVKQGTPDDGRPADHRRRPRRSSSRSAGRSRAAIIAPLATLALRRAPRRRRRLPERPDRRGDPRPPEAAVADRRRARRRVADPEHLRDHRHPGAVRRRRRHRPAGSTSLRRLRDRRRSATASTSPTASTAWPAARSSSRSSRS